MFGRKKFREQKKNTLQDKVAGKIASAGIKLQTKFSKSMNKLFSNIPVGKLKILVVIFCICSGGFSTYLISDAVFSPAKNQPSFKVDQINVPKHYDRTGDEMIIPENYVDEESYQQIQRFKQYMDSLKLNKSKLYDSIIITRPGLMDSVLMLEEVYHSQKIK